MKLVLVLAGVVFGSVAQAVMYTWSSGSWDSEMVAHTDITSFTIAVTYKNTGASSNYNHDYFTIAASKAGSSSEYNASLKMSVNNGTGTYQYTKGSATTTLNDPTSDFSADQSPSGRNIATYFSFSDPDADGVGTVTVKHYLYTSADSSKMQLYTHELGEQTLNFNNVAFDTIIIPEYADVSTVKITVTGTATPEPGVLGLLALGVGALALRRKVA